MKTISLFQASITHAEYPSSSSRRQIYQLQKTNKPLLLLFVNKNDLKKIQILRNPVKRTKNCAMIEQVLIKTANYVTD